MQKSLHENQFYRLLEDHQGFWILERTSKVADNIELLEEAHLNLWATMRERVHRKVLLVDLRKARGRNDEAFEKSIAEFRMRVTSRPKKVIMLVRTQLGVMHVERHARKDGVSLEVYVDEERALAAALARV